MERVFLAGTTTGTAWRKDLIDRLVARNVDSARIVNPHLPRGVRYTTEHMLLEEECQEDPETIIVIVVCPAVVRQSWWQRLLRGFRPPKKSEWLGPISMMEIGRFAWSAPGRTAIFLDYARFTEGRRPRKVLVKIARQLEAIGTPPYFSSMNDLEDWIVEQLGSKP